jgi:signal transduction histidine kinase
MGWVRRLYFAAAFLPVLAGHAPADGLDRVLLLHSVGPYFSPWSTISPQFREQLSKRSRNAVDIYEASLQGERIREAPEENSLIGYINALFPQRDLKLIVAMGAPATRFVLRHRAELFPSAPLLVASSDVRTFSDLTLGNNDTACATLYDPTVQIDTILRLLPDTKDILVATGAAPNGDFWTNLLQRSFERYAPRVTFHWFSGLTSTEMLKRVETLPSRSAIFYVSVNSDALGAPLEGDVVLLRSLDIGRAPVFTHVDSHFGRGIIGGPMFSSREIAEKCADVAVRLLNGENAADVTTPPIGLAAPVYDWRQLQRWHISELLLPPGSTVQFYEPGLWETYRLYIAALVAALLVQGALISWLIFEHRRRSLAEIRSRNAMAELANMNRLATAGQLSASIAHEINQPVTGIVLKASAALRWLAIDKPDIDRIRDTLTDIRGAGERAGEIITSVRAMFNKDSRAKVPVNLNNMINTVLVLLRVDLQKEGVSVEMQLDEQLPTVKGDAVQLQQVILNLLVNAADAMRGVERRLLKIETSRTPSGMVRVSIEDTGPGIRDADRDHIFEPLFTTKASGMGMGLSICRSIIENHGGTISVAAGAEKSTIFCFELPTAVQTASPAERAA